VSRCGSIPVSGEVGTRTTEGSRAYTALLSVIETCRLRNQDPWQYIGQTIALGIVFHILNFTTVM